MNKTYGGSIVKFNDQSEDTKAKFKNFLHNMKIDPNQISKYRVFIPFNI